MGQRSSTVRVILTADLVDIVKLDRLVEHRGKKFFTRASALREALDDYLKKHAQEIAWITPSPSVSRKVEPAKAAAVPDPKPHIQVEYKVAPTTVHQTRKVCSQCEAGYCRVDGKTAGCQDNKFLLCLCPDCWPDRAGIEPTSSNAEPHIARLREALAVRVKQYEAMAVEGE